VDSRIPALGGDENQAGPNRAGLRSGRNMGGGEDAVLGAVHREGQGPLSDGATVVSKFLSRRFEATTW